MAGTSSSPSPNSRIMARKARSPSSPIKTPRERTKRLVVQLQEEQLASEDMFSNNQKTNNSFSRPVLRPLPTPQGDRDDFAITPRRRTGQDRRAPVVLTREIIERYFSMPLSQASRDLGLCATAIKKVCRKMGIAKWPFRVSRDRLLAQKREEQGVEEDSLLGTSSPHVRGEGNQDKEQQDHCELGLRQADVEPLTRGPSVPALPHEVYSASCSPSNDSMEDTPEPVYTVGMWENTRYAGPESSSYVHRPVYFGEPAASMAERLHYQHPQAQYQHQLQQPTSQDGMRNFVRAPLSGPLSQECQSALAVHDIVGLEDLDAIGCGVLDSNADLEGLLCLDG